MTTATKTEPSPNKSVERTCSECGKGLLGRHPTALTCSRACAADRKKPTYRKWYQLNKDKVCASQKKYVEKNPERVRSAHAAYRERNPAKCREASRRKMAEYRAAHAALRELNLI